MRRNTIDLADVTSTSVAAPAPRPSAASGGRSFEVPARTPTPIFGVGETSEKSKDYSSVYSSLSSTGRDRCVLLSQ